jgi:hypothetical protein
LQLQFFQRRLVLLCGVCIDRREVSTSVSGQPAAVAAIAASQATLATSIATLATATAFAANIPSASTGAAAD